MTHIRILITTICIYVYVRCRPTRSSLQEYKLDKQVWKRLSSGVIVNSCVVWWILIGAGADHTDALLCSLQKNACAAGICIFAMNFEDLRMHHSSCELQYVALNKEILQMSIAQSRTRLGLAPGDNKHQDSDLQYQAYKNFAHWILRNEVRMLKRIVLSSCVVSAIRKCFPSNDGTYTGFWWVYKICCTICIFCN